MKKKNLEKGIKLSRMALEKHDEVMNQPLYLTERMDELIMLDSE